MTPQPAKKRRKLLPLLLGVVLFAGVIALTGDDSFYKLGHLNPIWLVMACGGVGLMMFLFSQRWRLVANALAGRVLDTRTAFFFYTVTSSATSLFMPQSANVVVVRTVMLNRLTGAPAAQAGASVLLDKLFDLLPVLILAPPALILLADGISLEMMLVIIGIEVFIASLLIRRYHGLYPRIVAAFLKSMARLPLLKRLRMASRLESIEFGQLNGDAVPAACWLTLIGTLVMWGRSWLIGQTIGLSISPLELLAGIALAQASLILAVTPGSLGTLELGWYVGLKAAGVPDEPIGAFLLAHRLLQSVFVLVIYLLIYVLQLATGFKHDMIDPDVSHPH